MASACSFNTKNHAARFETTKKQTTLDNLNYIEHKVNIKPKGAGMRCAVSPSVNHDGATCFRHLGIGNAMLLALATMLFTIMFAVAAASIIHDLTRPLAAVDRGIALPLRREPARQVVVGPALVLARVNRRPVPVRATPVVQPLPLAVAA
jgi:hypothetical protein